MNVLAIGAHFDDLELGCGGALARHVLLGDNVTGFIATKSGYDDAFGNCIRESKSARVEGGNAAKIIGYSLYTGDRETFQLEFDTRQTSDLLKIVEESKPDLIYSHWENDIHHDHRNLALATLHVARHVSCILQYHSNWYEGNTAFHGNCFVDITDTLEKKIEALKQYRTELNRTGDAWLEWIVNEAIVCGKRCGRKYAESFHMTRWIL